MKNNNYPKIILFLGSGASYFAGYRTFESFPDLIFNEEIRTKENLPPLHPNTVNILREIEQQLKIERKPTTHDNFLWKLNDYKKLWQMLSVDGVLQSRFLTNTNLWGDFSYFAKIAEDATIDITTTTVNHYSLNRVKKAREENIHLYESLKSVYSLYERLAFENNADAPFLPIFTTNYDMLLEDLFLEFRNDSNKLPFINGITDSCQEGASWSSLKYEQKELKLCGFHLYRIHGCVCWYFLGYGDEHVYFHRRDCLQQDFKNLCVMYPGRQNLTGINPHGYSFRKLYHMLFHCETIIFIGFSFRDNDIKILLLAANAQRNKPINIIVIDPTLHNIDITLNFEKTVKETQFTVKIPKSNEIQVIEARFGSSQVNEQLLDVIKNILILTDSVDNNHE